jgi:hypothetical protein
VSTLSGNDQAVKTWNPHLLRIPEAKLVQKIAYKYCGSRVKSCAKHSDKKSLKTFFLFFLSFLLTIKAIQGI